MKKIAFYIKSNFFYIFSYILLGGFMAVDDFKKFVNNNTYLVDRVKNKLNTWQDFYELYDLYGENSEVWEKYKNKSESKTNLNLSDTSLKDIFNMIKKIDLESFKKGVNGLEKAITLLQSFTNTEKSDYVAKPLYKHFED